MGVQVYARKGADLAVALAKRNYRSIIFCFGIRDCLTEREHSASASMMPDLRAFRLR